MTLALSIAVLILLSVVVVLVGENRVKQRNLEKAGVLLMESAIARSKIQRELDGSNRCLEMLLEEQTRELQDAHKCLELVLEENLKSA